MTESTVKRSVETFNESGKRVNRLLLTRLARKVLAEESVLEYAVTIVVVDNEEISRLNKQFLKHNGPTDVIAFPYEEQVMQCDLFVSLDQAELQAAEYGVTVNNELARLVIHGLLHLMGCKDDTPARRGAMRRRENRHLNEIEKLNTVRNWITHR
jgi:probable rRNA maturation factor